MEEQIRKLEEEIRERSAVINQLLSQVKKVIVGQEKVLESLLICLLCRGHALVEGVPGLAKTLIVKTLASALDLDFARIQFTPDLLPADITGSLVFNPAKLEFFPKKGPIFTNILLADEINRAPAKVQSALLEAMQELQVTIGDSTFPLPRPFFVAATQNPIEQEGTYPLPEAQIDRFMMKILIDYPAESEELEILRRTTGEEEPEVSAVVSRDEVVELQSLVRKVYVDSRLQEYIVKIVAATRRPEKFGLKIRRYISYGASPRGSIYLTLAAKARAFLKGRAYVIPEDIKAVAREVLRHRLILSYEAEAEEVNSDQLVATILSAVQVP